MFKRFAFTLTPSAKRVSECNKKKLESILKSSAEVLRVKVESGGCSGFQYKILLDKKEAADVLIDNLVVIDPLSYDIVKDASLDYKEELIGSSFKVVNNPKASLGCGCGVSFDLKEDPS